MVSSVVLPSGLAMELADERWSSSPSSNIGFVGSFGKARITSELLYITNKNLRFISPMFCVACSYICCACACSCSAIKIVIMFQLMYNPHPDVHLRFYFSLLTPMHYDLAMPSNGTLLARIEFQTSAPAYLMLLYSLLFLGRSCSQLKRVYTAFL